MDNIRECLYSTYHLWLKEFEDNKFIVGITSYIVDEMGSINKVNLTDIGAHLMEGDIFGTLENSEEVFELTMPLDAEIIDVNPKVDKGLPTLVDNPLLIWLIKIKLTNEDQVYELLNEIEYSDFIV